MNRFLITLAALLLSAPAFANVICAGCEDGDAAGNFLGAFDATRGDVATFQNSDIDSGTFADFWVFDLTPSALGSLSADFTLLASISGFFGELYRDAGSVCGPQDCTSIALGPLLVSANAFQSRWEIVEFFAPDRYVLKIGGRAINPLNQGLYTAQMAFLALAVPIREPGTLGLLGAGLLLIAGVGVWRRRRRP